jgi:hypothetical protein
MRTHVFSDRLISEGALRSSIFVAIMGHAFTIHGEVKGGE